MSERLYDIGESLREHLESTPFIDDETGEVDPGKLIEWENGLAQFEADFRDKLEAVGVVALEMKGNAENLKAEIARLSARKTSIENQRRQLLQYATDEMIKSDIGKHRSPRDIFTVYLQKGQDRLDVENAAKLPRAYQRITIEADKTRIKNALKDETFTIDEANAAGIFLIPGSQGVRYK